MIRYKDGSLSIEGTASQLAFEIGAVGCEALAELWKDMEGQDVYCKAYTVHEFMKMMIAGMITGNKDIDSAVFASMMTIAEGFTGERECTNRMS